MSTDPRAQLGELRHLSMSDLKQRWRDLIGTDPPQYSRSCLVSRLAYRFQELAYGGLREATAGFLHDGFPAGNGIRGGAGRRAGGGRRTVGYMCRVLCGGAGGTGQETLAGRGSARLQDLQGPPQVSLKFPVVDPANQCHGPIG